MNMLRYLAFLAGMWVASVCAAQEVSTAVRSELSTGGSLRVGLNMTKTATVTKDAKTGELHGVAVDLSRALANALGGQV